MTAKENNFLFKYFYKKDEKVQVNRMRDSLDLFSTLINWKKKFYTKTINTSITNTTSNIPIQQQVKETLLFEHVSIILFLNKEDLFEEKFKLSPLSSWFDDYDESKHGCSSSHAKEFIARKFIECDSSHNTQASHQRDIYWHYTYALDRKNIETVVASVKDRILKYMLESMRL